MISTSRRAAGAALLALGMLATLAGRPALAEPVRYELDPSHLTIAFLIGHIGYAQRLGIFHEASGGFTFDEAENSVSDIEVVVQTASVDVFVDRATRHVRSKDFLNVEAFPEMVFAGLEAVQDGDDRGTVAGNLTLLGETRRIELTVVRNKSAPYPYGRNPPNTIGLSLRGTLNRSDFGMTYGVADGLVGDQVDLIIEAEATAAE